MTLTIINDCRDNNATGRQTSRASTILRCPINFIGVDNEIEAAGNLIDVLDSFEEKEGIILLNVAPRNNEAKKWKNGSPFGYFWYKNTLIISTIDGLSLSLAKKLKLTKAINSMNIPTVVEILFKKGYIAEEQKKYISNTQFRSFDFLPRIAEYLVKEKNIESEVIPIEEISDMPNTVWWIDNFGNCKTTLLKNDLSNKNISIKKEKLTYYERLKDVPNSEPALITGSSGLGHNRFLEIVMQGKPANKNFDLSVGVNLNL